MDLFKLLGTIAIDNTNANKELSDTSSKAKGVAKDVGGMADEGEKSGGKFGNAMKKVGSAAVAVGKAVGVGMIAAGTAVAGLVTKSIQSYADYEQLVGGVETLFKDSADKVMEYANNAYKTAGLSANEYMETVTSFSASLLQSLDGDTNAAAEKANMAITDMSDNANKMGTSMEMIQNAYNGFAKANYTMLDNLKLGYGGTQEEMQRLLKDAEAISGIKYDISSYGDVVDAIHVIQTEMGITGTTAKEASSTISGSIGMMKASWTNLITAMSDENADFGGYVNNFVDSVATVADNLMPRIEIALNGVVQLIEKLAPVIISKVPELLSTLLPSIVNAATGMINALVDILPGLVTAITDILPALIDGFVTIINGLVKALPSVIQALVNALPTLIPAIIEGLTSMIVTLVTVIPQIIQPILEALPGIITLLVETLLNALPTLITGITMMITELINMLPQVLPAIIQGIMSIITMIIEQLPVILPQIVNAIIMIINLLGEQLPVLIPMLVQAIIQIINMLIEQLPIIIPMVLQACIQIIQAVIQNLPIIIKSLAEALPAILKAVWDAIVMIFENLPEWFGMLFEGAVLLIQGAFDSIGAFFSGIWDGICDIFAPVGDFFSNMFSGAWEGIKSIWNSVTGFFSGIWDGIKNAFGAVGNFFKNAFSGAWNNIKNVFSGVRDFFLGIWDKIKSAFSAIGTKIGDAISGAVKKGINGVLSIIENVINGFLKMINGAIDLINLIPGVNISKVKLVSFAKLAKGGVVDEPTPAIFGEDGAEAVVPLERNQGWLEKVASNLHSFMAETAKRNNQPNVYNYPAQSDISKSDVASVRADVESTKQILDNILERLDQFFPEAIGLMGNPVPAVIGVDQAADALTEPINYRLGRIAAMKGRGR